MENKYYNILWIDDEHEGMSGFKGDAKLNGIKLVSFKSLNDGISELRKNYLIYDGVILDAKFFENEDDIRGSEDIDNVFRAMRRLLSMEEKKFEIFVLTAQAEAFNDDTFKKAFQNVYRKAIDSDVEKLFSDVKLAADNHEDTQIRHKYNKVFDVCTDRYIGKTAGHDLLDLLKHKENGSSKLNLIRKIIEDLFQAFGKYELLPKSFLYPRLSLTEINKFLSGEKTIEAYENFKLNEESILPTQISHYLKNILLTTHNGSHRGSIDAHINYLKTPYLFKSILFQLLDVLIWFKHHIDQKPITKNWQLKENSSIAPGNWISGQVIRIAENGYGTFQADNSNEGITITPPMITKYQLKEGDNISVTIKPSQDGKKTYINEISKNL